MDSTEKKTITVGVYGGIVQWIQGIPEDVRIVVHDYDIDGAEDRVLSRDENGDKCVEAVWEKEDSG